MTPQRTILMTAFEPFGGRTKNASAEALAQFVDQLDKDFPLRVVTRGLPVAAGEAGEMLRAAIDEVKPDYVLCLGEAKRPEICLERVGWNERRFTQPDNAGNHFNGTPIREGGPASYPSTLPLDAMLSAMQQETPAARFSDDAGRYLCNEALYTCLDHIARHGLNVQAGFIHVPLLPEHAASPDDAGSTMPTGDVVRALAAGLRRLAQAEPSEG